MSLKSYLITTLALALMSSLAQSAVKEIIASEDAWVSKLQSVDPGQYTDRLVVNNPWTNNVKAYLKFDASKLMNVDEVQALKVYLRSSFEQNRGRVYLLLGDSVNDWNEDSISWSNAPMNFTSGEGFVAERGRQVLFLGYLEPAKVGEFTLNIDPASKAGRALTKALNEGSKTVTLAIDAETGNQQIVIESRTSGMGKAAAPRLVVDGF